MRNQPVPLPGSYTRIFLFDLDGVLIRPLGYRRAVQDSFHYFMNRLGYGQIDIGEEIQALFESKGITSEWDMVPILLVIALDQIPGAVDQLTGLTLEQALNRVPPESLKIANLEFHQYLQCIPDHANGGNVPAGRVYQLIQEDHSFKYFNAVRKCTFLPDILLNTRDPVKSHTTRLFQNLTLGTALFRQAYSLTPIIEIDSYLEKFDRPLIEKSLVHDILRNTHSGEVKTAIFTARPSLPPASERIVNAKPSPEAEIAARIVGLETLPLVGYGSLTWLAEQNSLDVETLVKPSPVQALAAIFTALTGDLKYSLRAALSITQTNRFHPILINNLASFEVHVFEDSPIGVQACQAAVSLLEKRGFAIRLKCNGISENRDKIAALKNAGAKIFPSVNDALIEAGFG